MKEFRSLEDVDGAKLPPDATRVVRGTLKGLIEAYENTGEEFDPDEDGYTVLVEEADTDDTIRAAIGGYTLHDALFEGAIYSRGHFATCILFNNQFGISIVIPDAPWLDPKIRTRWCPCTSAKASATAVSSWPHSGPMGCSGQTASTRA